MPFSEAHCWEAGGGGGGGGSLDTLLTGNRKRYNNNNNDNNNNNNDINNNCIERRNSRFVTISTLRCELSNNYAQVARVQSCADNMPCAIWYQGTAQLLSLTDLKSHLF